MKRTSTRHLHLVTASSVDGKQKLWLEVGPTPTHAAPKLSWQRKCGFLFSHFLDILFSWDKKIPAKVNKLVCWRCPRGKSEDSPPPPSSHPERKETRHKKKIIDIDPQHNTEILVKILKITTAAPRNESRKITIRKKKMVLDQKWLQKCSIKTLPRLSFLEQTIPSRRKARRRRKCESNTSKWKIVVITYQNKNVHALLAKERRAK